MTKLRPWLLLGGLALVCGCRGAEPRPSTGSETHFLSWCSGAAACGEGLECVCGVCTRACSESASCLELAAAAECVAVDSRPADQACSDAPVTASCEVACEQDADCADLGETHRCDRGFCRRLPVDCRTGSRPGSEVVLLGDSFLAESGEIAVQLQELARAAGALGAGDGYRDYSSSLITPFGGSSDLAAQYAAARDEAPVRIVVMNAGGPDVLLSCPEPVTESCPALQSAVMGADELWQQMAADGVEAVVDFFYPDPGDAELEAKLNVLRPMMQANCQASPVACHWLDLRPTFAGQDGYLLPSGMAPTAAGSSAAAAAIWSLMQRQCLAQ